MNSNRRNFMGTMGAFAGWLAVKPEPSRSEPRAMGWDMSWLDRLTGKHKQVFDFSNMEIGLFVVSNWLNAHQEVYGLKPSELSAVVGIGGHAFPVNAGDALYTKYPIGELWKVTDPTTGKPALRNICLEGGASPPEITPRACSGRTLAAI